MPEKEKGRRAIRLALQLLGVLYSPSTRASVPFRAVLVRSSHSPLICNVTPPQTSSPPPLDSIAGVPAVGSCCSGGLRVRGHTKGVLPLDE